jgi:hypothetical protein
MTNYWRLLALVVTISLAPATKAEEITNTIIWENSSSWMELNKGVEIRVEYSDGVKDGCWINAKTVKTAVELELKRSGYNITQEAEIAKFHIFLTSFGGDVFSEGSCAVAYDLGVWWWNKDEFSSNEHKITAYVNTPLWKSGGMLTGPKNGMNGRLKEKYVDLVQNFLNGIDVKRRAVLKEISESVTLTPEAKAYWSNYKID